MKLENLEIKRSETRNANVLKYRDWVIIFLKNQVMLRDNILLEQKFLLDKNAISNTISYTGLKVVDKIEEDPNQKPKDFVLPPIGSNRGIGNAQSMKINKKVTFFYLENLKILNYKKRNRMVVSINQQTTTDKDICIRRAISHLYLQKLADSKGDTNKGLINTKVILIILTIMIIE